MALLDLKGVVWRFAGQCQGPRLTSPVRCPHPAPLPVGEGIGAETAWQTREAYPDLSTLPCIGFPFDIYLREP